MSPTGRSSVLDQVDAAVDDVQREREWALAELYDMEAAWWALLFEQSRTRVAWRAALVAHEHARLAARGWRRRADAQQAHQAASPRPALGTVA